MLALGVVVFALLGVVKLIWLQVVVGALDGSLGAAVGIFTILEQRAEHRDDRHKDGARLRTRIGSLGEANPHRLGIDHEAAVSLQQAARDPKVPLWEYVPRDRDPDLRRMLQMARDQEPEAPALIVVSGPSKAGKSRTLFEAACKELPHAQLIAPRNRDALVELMAPTMVPRLPAGPVVLWLDDLETFLRLGGQGFDLQMLEHVQHLWQPGVVLATYGGKGTEHLPSGERQQLEVPVFELLNHPRTCEIGLECELSPNEVARAATRYSLERAPEIARGIGEYMVAAAQLGRKLRDGRHQPGDPVCFEGQALVWAAIDWRRNGLVHPVPRELLRELFRMYLDGLEDSDQRFQTALEWAQRAVSKSIRLVSATDGGFQPYDFVVSYADRELQRDVREEAWERIFETTDDEGTFAVATAAYFRGRFDRAERAWGRTVESANGDIALLSANNLGTLLHQRGDVGAALVAYRAADNKGHAVAALNLGGLLMERGDVDGALAALHRADERGLPEGTNALGAVLSEQGEFDGAVAAFRRAAALGHADAAHNVGILLEQHGEDDEALAAFRRSDELGSGAGANALGAMLMRMNKIEDAMAAYRRADERGDPTGPSNLGALLLERGDIPGALAAYQRADDRGSASGALNLGLLLERLGNTGEALSAYTRARARGHISGLGNLMELLSKEGQMDQAIATIFESDQDS